MSGLTYYNLKIRKVLTGLVKGTWEGTYNFNLLLKQGWFSFYKILYLYTLLN